MIAAQRQAMLKQLTNGIMLALLFTAASADSPHVSRERQAELIRLVRQDCGSCHGMRLTGGLGPALTPEALRDKPAEALIQTILQGRPGTPMPPWKDFISGPEAAWIVNGLKKGFPDVR
jgi:cytochrome c55X